MLLLGATRENGIQEKNAKETDARSLTQEPPHSGLRPEKKTRGSSPPGLVRTELGLDENPVRTGHRPDTGQTLTKKTVKRPTLSSGLGDDPRGRP